jgi:hypothetical protein
MRPDVWLVCLLPALTGAPATGQEITTDPDRVRLEVSDIRRLAVVLRSLESSAFTDTVGLIERDYLAHATPGLRAYAERYEVTAASIAAAIAAQPARYADLDGLADAILAQDGVFRAAFRELLEIFPAAALPPVWFVVGHNGPGGTARQEGALIAAERFASRPHDLVPLVMHELAHFQQAMVQGVDVYQRIYGPDRTLLALALREGSAELVARFATGRHTNPEAERYGLANEAALWARFRGEMHDRDTGDWMFVQPTNPDWPPNLGYWIGYRIAASYYDRAEDKRQAIVDILGLTDFHGFLEAAFYEPTHRPK